MTTKHTPGPWHITHEPTLNTFHVRIEDIDAAPIASLFYSSGGSRPQLSRELIDANARLIAAAPHMLAACRAMLADLREARDTGACGRSRDSQIVDLAAAIARAEGGAA